jgi:hypothetical protein
MAAFSGARIAHFDRKRLIVDASHPGMQTTANTP